jgi:hypothetical protein
MRAYLKGAGFVILFVTATIFYGLGLLGQEDYKIEVAEHENYISMVCSKAWPDYKNLSPICD